MSKDNDLSNLLIKIGEHYLEPEGDELLIAANDLTNEFINGIQPRYGLDTEDVRLISILFHRLMKGERKVESMKFLNDIYPDSGDMVNSLERVINLIKKRVLDCENRIHRHIYGRRTGSTLAVIDRAYLLDTCLLFYPTFIKFIMSDSQISAHSDYPPYQNNKEFLKEIFGYIDQLEQAKSISKIISPNSESDEIDFYNVQRDYIDRRLANSSADIPFKLIAEEYSLNDDEQTIIMHLLFAESSEAFAKVRDVLKVISSDFSDIKRKQKLIGSDSKLYREGLIMLVDPCGLRELNEYIQLTPDIVSRLINDGPIPNAKKITDVISENNLFTLRKPENDFSSLVLDDKTIAVLRDGLAQFNSDSASTMSYWGFGDDAAKDYSFDALIYNDYRPSLITLLYGLPGTGKTYTAYAIAKELGKDVLVTDMSRILSKWIGVSEQNVTSIFTTFNKICKRADNPPVLLLNEADQFLARRGITEYSTDRMYNQMQNLFLEQFERFKGVLIATTNLVEGLDPAFSRRFTLKVKFDLPGPQLREKLWKKLIPENTPLADDVNIEYLAKAYIFSGGQILNVVLILLHCLIYRMD